MSFLFISFFFFFFFFFFLFLGIVTFHVFPSIFLEERRQVEYCFIAPVLCGHGRRESLVLNLISFRQRNEEKMHGIAARRNSEPPRPPPLFFFSVDLITGVKVTRIVSGYSQDVFSFLIVFGSRRRKVTTKFGVRLPLHGPCLASTSLYRLCWEGECLLFPFFFFLFFALVCCDYSRSFLARNTHASIHPCRREAITDVLSFLQFFFFFSPGFLFVLFFFSFSRKNT